MRAAYLQGVCLGGLALLMSLPAWGQAPITPPATYLSHHWTTEDGLPVNTINDLAQTLDGFLWIATWDGLVRFDGLHFRSYTAANTDALPSSRIDVLFRDQQGDLWVMTEQRELVRYRDGVFTRYDETNGLPAPLAGPTARIARPFAETPDGAIWFGTERGVSRYREGTMEPFLPDQITAPVTGVAGDPSDTLWFSTLSGWIYELPAGGTLRTYAAAEGLSGELLYNVLRDAEGRVWTHGEGGIHVRVGDRFQEAVYEKPAVHTALMYSFLGPEGQLWVDNAWGTIYRSRPGSDVLDQVASGERVPATAYQQRFDWWTQYDAERAANVYLHHGQVGAVLGADLSPRCSWPGPDGSFWLGTTAGLFRYSPASLTVWDHDEKPAINVYPIAQAADGAVWLGTLGNSLFRIAGSAITQVDLAAAGVAMVRPWALHRAPDEVLWVGGHNVCPLPANPATCLFPEDTYSTLGEVRVVHQDQQGRFWMGAERGLAYQQEGTLQLVTEAPGVTHAWVRAIHEQADGTLWFGTNGGGVFRLRGDTFEPFSRSEGFCSNLVRGFHEDADGYLWVATEDQGLCRISNPTAALTALEGVSLSQAQGLGETGVHAVLEDHFGRFWMSTNRGLLSVPRADLNAVADGRAERVYPVRYDERDGMRNREANGGVQHAALKDAQGRLWFATQEGAVMIDPARLPGVASQAPVVLDAVASGGDDLLPQSTIQLAPEQRDLTILYTVPRFDKPEAVRFQYRLLGQDDDWFDAGTERQARFTNLGPGRYTFQVRALDALGRWQGEATELAIRRTPFFRETGWFVLLIALGTAALVLGGVRYRFRQVEARSRALEQRVADRTQELQTALATVAEQADELKSLDAAKSRFFANISHEFRTPLTLIIGPLRSLLAGHYGAMPAAATAQHQLMLRNSRRLLRLVNQILDLAQLERGGLALRAQRQDAVPFIRNIVEAFRPLARQHGLALSLTHPPYPCWLYFDPQHLEVVLLNLLSNAFKFTLAGGEVQVQLEEGDEALRLSVTDTGRGISAEGLAKIFDRFYQEEGSQGTGIGLALVQELVHLHGGTITAASTPGQGTTFVVQLPKGHDHLSDDQVLADAAVASDPDGDGWHSEPPPSLVNATQALAAEPAEAQEADVTTVLVVDDNPDIRQYLRSLLAPTYHVLEAPDGAAGLERVRSDLPDLVVSDVMMPHKDGFAFSRELKADPMTAHIPVILLTAKASKTSALEGLDTGADDYLTKPFDADELRARIRNQLATRQRLRARYQGNGAPASAAAPEATPAPKPNSLEAQARAVIRERLGDPDFSVRDLAAHLNLTYATFNRQLRAETDVKPAAMIRETRLAEAAALLKQHAGSVSEVAYGVGFNNLSYFSRCFREQYGVLPSAYVE